MNNINKIAIYCANFGNYRNELNKGIDNGHFSKKIDYYFFTDNDNLKSEKWKIIKYKKLKSDEIMDGNRWTSKYVKFVLPNILKKYEFVIWMDSKKLPVKITHIDILKLLNDNKDIKVFNIKHIERNTIQEELERTIDKKKENIINAEIYMKIIQNFKNPLPLVDTCIFIRKTDSETNNAFNHVYKLLRKYGLKRDQNVYNYALCNINYPINNIQLINNFDILISLNISKVHCSLIQ